MFIKEAVNMDEKVLIKVLVNATPNQLQNESQDAHTTEGCLHLIFEKDNHLQNALFNILNKEASFDTWSSLEMQELHLNKSQVSCMEKKTYRLYSTDSASNRTQVRQLLSDLNLFHEANLWFIFHIKTKMSWFSCQGSDATERWVITMIALLALGWLISWGVNQT